MFTLNALKNKSNFCCVFKKQSYICEVLIKQSDQGLSKRTFIL